MKAIEKMFQGNITMWKLWLAFFAYTTVVALTVQLILLPYVFPVWHAGNGLLVGGDWLSFHHLASELAQKIHIQGWSAWELRPSGQAPAGIAAAIYALTIPQPWTMIPFNAALHATAALILVRIVLFFLPNLQRAIWAALPFVLYPSAMTWYTQIHKDGLFILGMLLFVYGWVILSQIQTWGGNFWPSLLAVIWIIWGMVIVWVVRPYGVQMMQGIGVIISSLLTGAFLIRAIQKKLPWRKALSAFLLAWILLGVTIPLFKNGIFMTETTSWEMASASEKSLGASSSSIVEQKLIALAVVREEYFSTYRDAASAIDDDKHFASASDVLAYLPRATEIAFLAPFPSHWFGQGSLAANTVMRRVAAIEMIGVYFTLPFLIYAVWHWRKRIDLWIIILFSYGMMVTYSIATPNIGTLYRMRYGFIMTLIAIGIAGGFEAWKRLKNSDTITIIYK